MKTILILFVCMLAIACAEVTILSSTQYIYDRSPKLRIKGTGFDADEHSINLELGATGANPLRVDKDFLITKDDEGLILKLLGGRKWVDITGRIPPVALILNAVRLTSSGDTNLLPAPVVLAQVLPTPTVAANEDIIFTTASNELRINGTGFRGAKKVDFFFDPPLFKEVGYEVVSKFPLEKETVVLRLRHGYKWREEPGPLVVKGIDTGGGAVKVGNDNDGIRVAEVQADMDAHGVTVEASATEQVIYHDQPSIYIHGTGFNKLGNTYRFTNGILGKGVNFTATGTTETSVTLKLSPGSHWRKNVENLPGFLTLLAVNAGEGWVAVGPVNAAKGRDIATVFERPTVYSSNTKVFRTHSHELHIKGVGFTKTLGKTELRFNPPLVEGEDYSIKVIDRTELEVTLADGHAWRADDGPLTVTAVNTKGTDDGWIQVGGVDGVHVAEIQDDANPEASGGVEVFPAANKVYQSVLHETIVITGTGFKEGMSVTFDPEIKEGTEFDFEVTSKNKLTLTLRQGKKWRADPGFIIAKMIKIGGKSYPLAGTDGIRVAIVLADPSVKAGKDNFHETQSKVIAIEGTGFTNAADTRVILSPTPGNAYQVMAVLDDVIRLQLKQGNDWLPAFMHLSEEDDKVIPLSITGIDTGAGLIQFDNAIVVGNIVKDRAGVFCDDSCEFAFDGTCDDGTEDEYYYSYSYYGYYEDDDLGGYYGEGTGEYYGEEGEGDFGGEGGEGYGYENYYMPDDGYRVSACVKGTDCTDCGGVDAIIDYTKIVAHPETDAVACENTCPYARDGVCDDPRGANYCKLGTDCQDCGVVGADNFTRADDDGWWDDDDDYWTFNDGAFLDQNKGIEANRHRVKTFTAVETPGPAVVFLSVLEGIVYTVGAIFAAAALYLGNRLYNGQSVPFLNVFNPDAVAAQEAELTTRRVVPVTPDFIRTG